MRSLKSIRWEIVPHRYIFHEVAEGGVEELEESLTRFRNKAHIAVIVPAARLEHLMGYLVHRGAGLGHAHQNLPTMIYTIIVRRSRIFS